MALGARADGGSTGTLLRLIRPWSVQSLLIVALLAFWAEGKPSYYDILEVTKDADTKAIKAAYRKMALKWHPDKNPDDRENAEKKFREVAEAYEVLSDPDRRRTYDLGGDPSGAGGGGGGGFGDFGDFFGRGGGGFHFKDPKDLFKEMFGNEDPFSDFSKFFDDVEVEEVDTGRGGDSSKSTEAMEGLEKALVEFYKVVNVPEKADLQKVRDVLALPKWKGKEMKMLNALKKKYSAPEYSAAVRTLEAAFQALEKSRRKNSSFGSHGMNFHMGGFGGMGGIDLSGFGGGGSSISISRTTMSGGKTVKSETKIEGGRRVTKTIETDSTGTRATLEEEENGKVRRQKGVKRAEQLDDGGGRDEF